MSAALVSLLVGGPILYERHRHFTYRNFRIVEEKKLYRCGQLSAEVLQKTIEEYGIKSVISLRYAEAPEKNPKDWREEETCKANGIRYYRIRPREWSGNDQEGKIPADKPFAEFLKIMDDPTNYPVLVHCFAGKHRTGSFCAMYRMEYEHWSSDEALQELKSLGYEKLNNEEAGARAYLSAYQPRWKRSD